MSRKLYVLGKIFNNKSLIESSKIYKLLFSEESKFIQLVVSSIDNVYHRMEFETLGWTWKKVS